MKKYITTIMMLIGLVALGFTIFSIHQKDQKLADCIQYREMTEQVIENVWIVFEQMERKNGTYVEFYESYQSELNILNSKLDDQKVARRRELKEKCQ